MRLTENLFLVYCFLLLFCFYLNDRLVFQSSYSLTQFTQTLVWHEVEINWRNITLQQKQKQPTRHIKLILGM